MGRFAVRVGSGGLITYRPKPMHLATLNRQNYSESTWFSIKVAGRRSISIRQILVSRARHHKQAWFTNAQLRYRFRFRDRKGEVDENRSRHLSLLTKK
jgi:hypothetical protein